jgi:hypothetical protein
MCWRQGRPGIAVGHDALECTHTSTYRRGSGALRSAAEQCRLQPEVVPPSDFRALHFARRHLHAALGVCTELEQQHR